MGTQTSGESGQVAQKGVARTNSCGDALYGRIREFICVFILPSPDGVSNAFRNNAAWPLIGRKHDITTQGSGRSSGVLVQRKVAVVDLQAHCRQGR